MKAEATASGAEKEPEILESSSFPATVNDDAVTAKISSSFADVFGQDFNPDLPRVNASEDFGQLATAIGKPSCFVSALLPISCMVTKYRLRIRV